MGNSSQKSDGLPKKISYQQAKQMIAEFNNLSEINKYGLKLWISLQKLEVYDHSNWKKIIVSAKILSPKKNTFDIAVTMKQVYKMLETLKYFNTKMKQSQMLTPSAITPDENQECCICLDKPPTMMLPCSHEFCDGCMEDHIINKQQKKCPICRHQFICGRQSLKEQIFTIIDDQKQVIQQVKQIILGNIGELNERIAKIIRQEFQSPDKQIQLMEKGS